MNTARIGTVTAAPDGSGMGLVALGGSDCRVYFKPERFLTTVPVVGDRVFVLPGQAGIWIAVCLIGLS